ncbi:MAG: phosphoribosylformylglycinamidine synthase subunit PurQ [Bifidobacteriaceae bacterium]|jgi:phosphoribosylformylglycinamidine synthase|nr:phosphoribosylformylglycinamidine synthase subunit PurQ [Bifidobacteriaceae bacterium]
MIRIGVVTFPGTLDDRDALRAVRLAGAEGVPLWHAEADLRGVDAVVLPGGFSYGDYLRAGAIARFAPVMGSIVDAARGGMPVLGICNGFQLLTESHLLPGAMIKNDHRTFICRDQELVVESTKTAWSNGFGANERIVIPLKNQDGQFVADERTLDELEDSGRVVFRYAGWNPNGSRRDIAGITNAAGNVVGLMPHPEHAVEAGFGPDTPAGPRSGLDGLTFFTSVVAWLGRVGSAGSPGSSGSLSSTVPAGTPTSPTPPTSPAAPTPHAQQ